ncbi:MAG: hypothetical protein ACRDXX_13865, partial [Stackebrandtia sp.]
MTEPEPEAGEHTPAAERRTLLVFGLAGGGIVVVGIIVVLALALTTGVPGGSADVPDGPKEDLPPLAEACPPPTEPPPEAQEPPATEGDRVVDAESGISYSEFDDPWLPWTDTWTHGDLKVSYRTGQYFVTEDYEGGQYMATILSGSVPAAVNDGSDLDLKCVSEQVAADVRASYYPQPNEMENIRDEAITLGGRPAWLREFRLDFEREGLEATDELVGVALIDVGRPEAAVLYVSIPGTHSEYDSVVSEVMESVRPAE